MSRSSDRAQTEPLPALIAVAMVALALGTYAGVLGDVLPGQSERTVAPNTLSVVEDHVAPAGVVRPARVSGSPAVGPDGYQTNVTVTTPEERWTAGPTPPENADSATEQAGVRVAPTRIRPGQLTVVVWT